MLSKRTSLGQKGKLTGRIVSAKYSTEIHSHFGCRIRLSFWEGFRGNTVCWAPYWKRKTLEDQYLQGLCLKSIIQTQREKILFTNRMKCVRQNVSLSSLTDLKLTRESHLWRSQQMFVLTKRHRQSLKQLKCFIWFVVVSFGFGIVGWMRGRETKNHGVTSSVSTPCTFRQKRSRHKDTVAPCTFYVFRVLGSGVCVASLFLKNVVNRFSKYPFRCSDPNKSLSLAKLNRQIGFEWIDAEHLPIASSPM